MQIFSGDDVVVREPVMVGTESNDVARLVLPAITPRMDPVPLNLVRPITTLYLAVLWSE